VTGIDVSESGVEIARRAFPHLRIEVGSAYADLAARYGLFPLVISLEVIEHLYDPRLFARNLFAIVEPGGTALISTPYHGYLKNLALALTGKLDKHFGALWDGGHIKFWSLLTLRSLLEETGFSDIAFVRVGRFPPLAKSMIAIARRPPASPAAQVSR
jgi:2-polyprenyl-6-hydroxyphenyl methylase/3-demethylubiquinone-9 3-methyltransferase